MKLTKREQAKLDKAIEQSYYKQANGRQISVLNIGALFKLAGDLNLKGMPIDAAVAIAIEQYCEPKGDV